MKGKWQTRKISAVGMTQGFMSTTYGFLLIREEVSIYIGKGIKHVHREPQIASGTLPLMESPSGGGIWPCINRKKKTSLTCHLEILIPVRHLSFCSCPPFIPPSCWHPTCSQTSLSGQNVTNWSLAKRCCLMTIWMLTGWGRGRRLWWRDPALTWLRVASCQVSWGNPRVLFLTSLYHSVT